MIEPIYREGLVYLTYWTFQRQVGKKPRIFSRWEMDDDLSASEKIFKYFRVIMSQESLKELL